MLRGSSFVMPPMGVCFATVRCGTCQTSYGPVICWWSMTRVSSLRG